MKGTAITIAAVIGLLAVSASADVLDIYGAVDASGMRERDGYSGSPQQPTGPWGASDHSWNSAGTNVYDFSGSWFVEE